MNTTRKPISSNDAMRRLMAIQESLHALIRVCHVSGHTEAADALDHVVIYDLDVAYDALAKRAK